MRKFRNGFSMMVAIFTIVIMSMVASYIFYASSSISKEGIIQYKREQAMLLARSYTEYAVMAISANDRNVNCLNTITATALGNNPNIGNGYQITVEITYIGNQKYINNCARKATVLNDSDIDTLSVILDVYVRYKDNANQNEPWQTYHRRSLQKIWEKKKHLLCWS